MVILTLDLGTLTGWALKDNHGNIVSGTMDFKPGRFEGGGMRYLRFKRWLSEIRKSVGDIDVVYFEEVRRHLGVDAAHTYGGFMSQLMAWCEDLMTPYHGVPVGTIKKSACGKGNANKSAMIEAAKARGHNPADDNEADAICLLYYVLKLDESG